MANKTFGSANFNLKDFKPKKGLGEVPKKKPGMIETASEETRKKLLARKK